MEPDKASSTPKESPARADRGISGVVVAVILLALAVAIGWWMRLGSCLARGKQEVSSSRTFSGGSDSLQQTVIIPTLDTPSPPHRNVIWCSSFQLAWNKLRDSMLFGDPLRVAKAEDIVTRLNRANPSVYDLAPGSFYMAGGRTGDGIIDRIREDMAAQFPAHVLPDLGHYADGILAYSYLTASVRFTYPFQQMERWAFTDSRGQRTLVGGLGLSQDLLPEYAKTSGQIEVLYTRIADSGRDPQVRECAIDLCRHSRPYQVVVAMAEPNDSLARVFEHVQHRIKEWKSRENYQERSRFRGADTLAVPEMVWRIDHRFRELIGKSVVNAKPALPIVEALQTIDFKLDRSGAMVESEAHVVAAGIPMKYRFNRPFLIYVLRRGAAQPFFAMWVDNAELLTRR